ncbi:MAG: hypothetical protein ACRDRV_04655 [Pseudonocardiaceae bacterium]
MTRPAKLRWVFAEDRAHVLIDNGDSALAPRTVCGLHLPAIATVYPGPPSLDVCLACVPVPGSDRPSPPGPLTVPPPTFSTPPVISRPAARRERCWPEGMTQSR